MKPPGCVPQYCSSSGRSCSTHSRDTGPQSGPLSAPKPKQNRHLRGIKNKKTKREEEEKRRNKKEEKKRENGEE
jgi:hypothetical protein